MSKRFPAFAVATVLVSASARAAQDLDVVPSYHPHGPGAGYAEVFPGDALTFELSLPGMDHAQSQAASGGWMTFLLAAVSTLPLPIPLAPGVDLWLDPLTMIVYSAPPSVELEGAFPLAAQTGITVPFQVAAIDLSAAPASALSISDVFELALALPPTRWGDEMCPVGSQAPGSAGVSWDASANAYVFAHTGPGGALEYVIDLDDPHVSRGTIAVLERLSGVWVLREAGMPFAQGMGQVLHSVPQVETLGTHTLLSHGVVAANTVELRWRSEMPKLAGGTKVIDRLYRFELAGRSLEVHAEVLGGPTKAEDSFYAFTLGAVHALGTGAGAYVERHIPYMDQIGVTQVAGAHFHSAFVDQFRSSASIHVPAQFGEHGGQVYNAEFMLYEPLDDGSILPVDETGWVTLSTDVRDVFVETTAPPSQHAPLLAERIGVTFARETNAPTVYLEEMLAVKRLAALGMSDVHLFKFHWTHFGTNRRATAHVPPNPQGGAQQQFLDMILAARGAGWVVALYTDYYSLDQAVALDDNPWYSETPGGYVNWEDAVRDNQGEFRKGYQISTFQGPAPPGSTAPESYNSRILAPRRTLGHMHREADVYMDLYGSNGAYFDVMTISAPDQIATAQNQSIGAISGDSRSPNDRTIRDAIDSYKSLFAAAAQRAGGPVVGEGSFVTFQKRFDTFYAGYLDATYRTLTTGGDPADPEFAGMYAPVIPDYEWNHVRGKHYGFAMGQYVRFIDSTLLYPYPIADALLDELRATQISYGHNGWFMTNGTSSPLAGGEYVTEAQRVKEYYTMRALQAAWAPSTQALVEYRDSAPGSAWMDLSTVLLTGAVDLTRPVLRVTLDTGLVMVINHDDAVVTELGYDLPKNGWAIVDPGSGLLDLAHLHPTTGTLVHHVACPGYEMGDGNGVPVDLGGALGTTSDLKVVRLDTPLTLVEGANGNVVIQ